MTTPQIVTVRIYTCDTCSRAYIPCDGPGYASIELYCHSGTHWSLTCDDCVKAAYEDLRRGSLRAYDRIRLHDKMYPDCELSR